MEFEQFETLDGQKVSKLSVEWISFSWKNHLKRKVLLSPQVMCILFISFLTVLKLQGQISDSELKIIVLPLKVS
jgi:hypothetical protein